MTTTRDDGAEAPDRAAAPPPPARSGRWGQRQRGLDGTRPVVLRQRFHRGFNAALVVSIVVAIGGRQGGGEKASGSPDSRGEEDKYRGWKVQGGVDEAQRMQEEEEGESVGGRDRNGVPRAGGGGRARSAGDGDAWWGPDDRAADAPPSRFGEGGSLLLPPVRRSLRTLWTAMARMVGIRSRRVIGVVSWYHLEATPLLDSETSCNFCDW